MKDGLSTIEEYGVEASKAEALGDLYAHPRYAHKWGAELGSPVTAGIFRTFGEIVQFAGYTIKNGLHAIGVNVRLGLDDRYNTFSRNYFKDSYYDIAITVSGASGTSFEQSNNLYNCRCNSPIGN